MKNLIFIFLILGLIKSYAQEPLEVKIEPRPSSQGVQTAFEVIVPQATPDDAMKLWEKTITSGGLFSNHPRWKISRMSGS